MAPLSHFHYLVPKHLLLCCLFLSIFFASSISFTISCNGAQCSSHTPQIPTGRRALLKTKPLVEDDEDEESLVQSPKKKKQNNDDDYDDDSKKVSDIKKQKQKQKQNKFSDEYEDHDEVLSKKSEDDYDGKEKKKTKPISNSSSSKNQTKMITKPISNSSSSKNQTKMITKTISNLSSSKNKTKLTKANEDSTPNLSKSKKVNKLNKTSSPTKKLSSDQLTKPNNKAKQNNTDKTNTNSNTKKQQQKQKTPPMWLTQDDDHYGLVSEFTDLPAKFQQTFVPDLQKISTTSQAYLTKANKEITKGFKPYVGYKYATSAATVTSFTSIFVPFVIIALLFRRIKAHFSLQRLVIFIQIYLSVYFFILSLSSVITGLEPLRFLYATQRSTYNCVQLIQTLGYFVYLVLAIMYLLLVFSNTDIGPVHKLLGLAQAIVGLAVGLHYYMSVVHRMLLRQPPKSSWKVHGFYATCFFVMCLSARVERRKKAYLGDGGQQEGKKN